MTSEPRYAVVIEDDPDTSRLIEMVLTQSGFTVVTAIHGLEGMDAVREHNPLLTTLDVRCRAWTASPWPSGCVSSASPT